MEDVVPVDPRLRWVQPEWLSEATAWIAARLEEAGPRADRRDRPAARAAGGRPSSDSDRVDLVEAAELAHFTGTAARTLAWHRFVSARDPEFRADDEEAIPYGLRRLLDLGPLGTSVEP